MPGKNWEQVLGLQLTRELFPLVDSQGTDFKQPPLFTLSPLPLDNFAHYDIIPQKLFSL